jgi:cation-transporting ATPase E
VNDVPALKRADLGIAMAAGSAAARTVAPLVLAGNAFDALPVVVSEGRRVIANVEQVAMLFVTKTVYASLIALAVGIGRVPFPFLPRQLTIISSLTIGIPAFFLALAPNDRPMLTGFVRRVGGFAVPAGVIAAAVTVIGFTAARSGAGDLASARTVATLSLFVIGLRLLSVLARPLTPLRKILLSSMAAVFVIGLALPPVRSFFALPLPSGAVDLEAIVAVGAGLGLVELLAVRRGRGRRPSVTFGPAPEEVPSVRSNAPASDAGPEEVSHACARLPRSRTEELGRSAGPGDPGGHRRDRPSRRGDDLRHRSPHPEG